MKAGYGMWDRKENKVSIEYPKQEPPASKCGTVPSAGRIMLADFCNIKGVMRLKFILECTATKSERKRRAKTENKNSNVRRWSSLSFRTAVTIGEIQCPGFTVVDRPLYSAELASLNFNLFPKVDSIYERASHWLWRRSADRTEAVVPWLKWEIVYSDRLKKKKTDLPLQERWWSHAIRRSNNYTNVDKKAAERYPLLFSSQFSTGKR